jgi:hypothetical protein
MLDADLYETDETAWLEESSRMIREGRLQELDYPHLSEYLQDMAKRDRREVRSRLVQLIAHLLKWQHQPDQRSASWKRTIFNQRTELTGILESKTLRNHAAEILAEVYKLAVKGAADETSLPSTSFPATCPFTIDQILDYDFLG